MDEATRKQNNNNKDFPVTLSTSVSVYSPPKVITCTKGNGNNRVPQYADNSNTCTNNPSTSCSVSTSSCICHQHSSYSGERKVPNSNAIGTIGIGSGERNQTESIVPEYNIDGPNRGYVLIINNITFDGKNDDRTGAENDEKCLIEMFQNFGFVVKLFRDLTKHYMLETVKEFRSALPTCDISVVVLMSHGHNFGIPGGYTDIFGTDGRVINTEDIVDEFTVENCPVMKGKPKLFIFQCCRGSLAELQLDTINVQIKPSKNREDVLIVYSTLPGFVSARNVTTGSWFIQCVCEVFQKYADTLHVEDMLKIVYQELSKRHPYYKQISTYENRGFKNCYLKPK